MRRALVLLIAIALGAAAVSAQRFLREGPGAPLRRPPPGDFTDGRFAFCKLRYTSVRREPMGIGWWTDYPFAGIHLMVRASELSRVVISRGADGEPSHWVVSLDDDALFQCPFVMASDVGTMGLSAPQVERLRTYLLKGGFLWVDDFWGETSWAQWSSQIARVLPPDEHPIRDLPADHPVLRTMHTLPGVPQVTNINNWRRTAGTSEQGETQPFLRGIADRHGRLLVLMSFNSDIGDSWEREGEDPDFFRQFSPDGYALGLNVLVYAMTH
ncbi:MAG: DUF4159 domain-containing protein [Acidimicrobiia bacterium]|nr:DUF4159 domain-containing protein [Acidimicrobiia bacterium]